MCDVNKLHFQFSSEFEARLSSAVLPKYCNSNSFYFYSGDEHMLNHECLFISMFFFCVLINFRFCFLAYFGHFLLLLWLLLDQKFLQIGRILGLNFNFPRQK